MPPRRDAEEALVRWRRMHLPAKLDTIAANIGEPLPGAVRRDVLSINTARAIFEHDGGHVTEARVRSNAFVLSFRGVDMAIRTMAEIVEVRTLPISMPADAAFEVSVEARERRFAVGDVLTLTAADFVDIGVRLR